MHEHSMKKLKKMGHCDWLKLRPVLEGYDEKYRFKSYWGGLIEDFRGQADSIKVLGSLYI